MRRANMTEAEETLRGILLDAAELYTLDGTGPYRLLPACARCNADAGRRYGTLKRGMPPARTSADLNVSRQW